MRSKGDDKESEQHTAGVQTGLVPFFPSHISQKKKANNASCFLLPFFFLKTLTSVNRLLELESVYKDYSTETKTENIYVGHKCFFGNQQEADGKQNCFRELNDVTKLSKQRLWSLEKTVYANTRGPKVKGDTTFWVRIIALLSSICSDIGLFHLCKWSGVSSTLTFPYSLIHSKKPSSGS